MPGPGERELAQRWRRQRGGGQPGTTGPSPGVETVAPTQPVQVSSQPSQQPRSNLPLIETERGLIPDLPAGSGEQAIRVRGSDGRLYWRSPSTILEDLQTGLYQLEPGNTYRLEDDDGNEFEVDAAGLADALTWHEQDPESNARLHIAGWEDERARAYREAEGPLGTFAESAGRSALTGMTVGLSDAAEGLIDEFRDPTVVARERRRRAAQAEENPIASFAGGMAGAIAPMALTGGAATAASGARTAATLLPRAAIGAGAAAERGVAAIGSVLGGDMAVARVVAREATENAIQALPMAAQAAVEADPDDAAEAALLGWAGGTVLGTGVGTAVRGVGAGVGAARDILADWASRRADDAVVRALEPRGRDFYNALANARIRPEMLRQYAPEALEAAGVPVATATDREIAEALADETTRRTVNNAYMRNYLAVMSAEVPDLTRGPEGRRLVRALDFGQDINRIAENVDELKGAAIRSIDEGLEAISGSSVANVPIRNLVNDLAATLDRSSPSASRLADDQILALEQEIEHVLLGSVRDVGQGAHGFRPRVFRIDIEDSPVNTGTGASIATAEQLLEGGERYVVRSARIRRGAAPNDTTAPVGSFLDLFRPSRADPTITVGDELVRATVDQTGMGRAVMRFLTAQTAESMDARETLRVYNLMRMGELPMEKLVKIRRGLDDIAYRHSQETNATAPATVAMRELGKDIASAFRRHEQAIVDEAAKQSPELAVAAQRYRHGQAMFQALEMVQPTANIAAYASAFRNRRMSLSDYNSATIASTALSGTPMSAKGGFLLLASVGNSLVRTRLESTLVAARRRIRRSELFDQSLRERNELTRKMVQDTIQMTSPPPLRRPASSVTPARTMAAVAREFARSRERLEEMERRVSATEQPALREVADAAPRTTMAIRQQAAAMVAALRARLPASAARGAPGMDEVLPSREEMDAFVRSMNIAESPREAFEALTSNPLPIEEMRLLREIYPRTFSQIQSGIQEALISGKFKPSYFQRMRLSLLFDITIDPTMQPSYLAQTQMAMQPVEEEPPAGGGAPRGRPVNLGASDLSTDAERVASRAARRNEP